MFGRHLCALAPLALQSEMAGWFTYWKMQYKEFVFLFLLLKIVNFTHYNFEYMDVVTGGRDCPTISNKHTLQLNWMYQSQI
jgi:hypothetical protein